MEHSPSCEDQQVLGWSRNSPHFMKPNCSSPHSPQHATCPCPQPYISSPCSPNHFLNIHFNIILPYTPSLRSGLLKSDFSTKTLHAPVLSHIHATCPACLILLELITRIIFGRDHKAPRYVVFSSPLSPHSS